jgi:hypothetical protein
MAAWVVGLGSMIQKEARERYLSGYIMLVSPKACLCKTGFEFRGSGVENSLNLKAFSMYSSDVGDNLGDIGDPVFRYLSSRFCPVSRCTASSWNSLLIEVEEGSGDFFVLTYDMTGGELPPCTRR